MGIVVMFDFYDFHANSRKSWPPPAVRTALSSPPRPCNTNRLGEGFYLALPADDALRTQADALARGESAAPPQLGIALAPPHVARRLRRAVGLPDTEGLLIQQVIQDSPAARAGLAPGDLIVAAAGRPVGDVDDLYDALQAGHRAAPSNSASCAAPTSGPRTWCSPQKPRATDGRPASTFR